MEFYGYIGCYEEEKRIGTRFSLSLTMQYDATASAQHDDLALAVNYQAVYGKIKALMGEPCNLIEAKAYSILQMLFHDFPSIEGITLSLSKLNPMLAAGGKVEAVTVTLSQQR